MSSEVPESPTGAIPLPKKMFKKEKKDKKKRIREDSESDVDERFHKRTKSTADELSSGPSPDLSAVAADPVDSTLDLSTSDKKEKKKKKDKKSKHAETNGDTAPTDKKKKKKPKSKAEVEGEPEEHVIELESTKKDKKKSKKKSRHDSPEPAPEDMDVDTPEEPSATSRTSRLHQPPDTPAKPQYPFFTQTVSLFLPLYPVGWAEPCTAAAAQHLEPMVNRYVPTLGGVLLAFRNVAVSENPGRLGAATSDSEICDLLSVDEYAVGFGWVTAEVDLFIPKRGAWMEGSVNLESEGHIGVVCWGKFNASIESGRLPPDWRWVHLDSDEAEQTAVDTVSNFTAEQEHGAVGQIHATGYWVDAAGKKIKGRLRFRIKSFDVGISGDHGYLSLEGTMLDKAGERDAVKEDVEQELRRRKGKSGGILIKERRRVPEFSVTTFGQVEDEEDKNLRQDVYNTTAPEFEKEGNTEKDGFAGISTEEIA